MNDLIKAVNDVDFENKYDKQAHKDIYSYITENILKTVDENDCPPVQLLIYGVQNIIYPELIRTQIPSLLDLLAQIELVRKRAVKTARDALEWNKLYAKAADANVLLLTDKERAICERIAGRVEDEKTRKIYTEITSRLCELHIHSLWTGDEEKIAEYMREYFPRFTKQTSSRLFHSDLNEAEQLLLHDVGRRCASFLRDAAEWERDLEDEWVSRGYPREGLYSDEEFLEEHRVRFSERFPEPVHVDNLVLLIARYAGDTVGLMVHDLEAIFR